MKDYALFSWYLLCACLGIGAEYTGQMLYVTGRWLMHQSEKLQAYALSISEIED
jgi:hypothetical protein